MNKLFYGDNLDILRRFVRDETVDLCYIDPPCNSKGNYNQIYNNFGQEDRAQAQAFVDTWTWDDHADHCFEDILTALPTRENPAKKFCPSSFQSKAATSTRQLSAI